MNEPTNNPDPKLDALFALARANRPDTSAAEFAFETRLLARLRAQPEAGSIWAMVSWRLIPIFAACVVALTIWQAEMASEVSDKMNMAALNNPVATDLWDN
jgi:hypothetical protein